jgi:hypothetical protein
MSITVATSALAQPKSAQHTEVDGPDQPADAVEADIDSTPPEPVNLGTVQKINRDELPALPQNAVEEQLGVARLPGWNVVETDRWLSNEGSVALLEQRYRGVEIAGTTMTVELDTRGDIIRINKAWEPKEAPTCDFRSDVAAARALSEWGVEEHELEPVYWPKLGGAVECAYRHQDEMFTSLVGADGHVVEHSSRLRHYNPAQANVTYRTYSPSGAFPAVGAVTTQLNIGKESIWFSPDCRFVLADPAGPHTLSRVLDDNGLEYEYVGACNSIPNFTNTNGDSMREASYFQVAQKTRDVLASVAWNHVSPQQSADVQISFDYGDPYCNACFNTVTTDIYFHAITAAGVPAWHSMPHEYGHYVSWTYGGSGGSCNYQVNESNSIEEAIGDVFRMAYMRKVIGTFYTDPANPFLPRNATSAGGPAQLPHTSVQYTNRCAADGYAIYAHSAPFSQAMWELINGSNYNGPAPVGLPWVTVANPAVEKVLRSLATTMNALGPDMTYVQLINRMALTFTSGAERNAFVAVFQHHGFGV